MNRNFLFACLPPFVVLVVQWLLWAWLTPFAWFMFFPAVFVSARLDGLRGGLVGGIISVALVWLFFLLPQQSGDSITIPRLFSTFLFMLMSYLISTGQEHLRRIQSEVQRLNEQTLTQNLERNDIYEHIVATSGNLLGFIDREHHYVLVNPPYAELCGLSQAEMEGRKMVDVLGTDNYARIVPQLNQALAGEAQHFIAKPKLSDGRIHVMEAEYRPFVQQGEVKGVVVSLRDITALQASEAALAASEERLRLTFDATHDGVWDWDLRVNLAYLSPHYYEITGYRAEDVTPDINFLYRTAHPDDLARVQERVKLQTQGMAKDSEFDYRIVTPTGEIKWIRSRGRCVERDANGTALRMVGTISDITTEKTTLDTLRRQTEELAQRNAEMERFNCASVGRELDMIALKRQVNALSSQLGQKPPFSLDFAVTDKLPPTSPV